MRYLILVDRTIQEGIYKNTLIIITYQDANIHIYTLDSAYSIMRLIKVTDKVEESN